MVSAWVEVWYLRLYLVFAFVIYMHWAVLVINRITTFLGINCLTIRKDRSVARDRVYRDFGEAGLSAARNTEDDAFKSH
jgi:ethanolaminephosphotransferase